MKILDYFKEQFAEHRSKHQVQFNQFAKATVNPAGTKLVKYFAKAKTRSPRGY